MDTKTALGAAGGISLTVAGAVSALVLTLGGGTSSIDQIPSNGPVVEYIDEYGNPIDLQQPAAAIPEIIITTEQPAMTIEPDTEMMAAPEPATPAYEDDEEEEEAEEYEQAEEDDDD
jgi:hypothetical protein